MPARTMSSRLKLTCITIAMIVIIAFASGIIFSFSSHVILGEMTSSIRQEWIDKENNIKILFNHSPEKPIIDSKTQMNFIVENLTTNKNLDNALARVVVETNSSGQLRTFKFVNIKAPNGNFAVNYIFPDSGLYQIVTRIDSKDFSTLASFKVDVPFQPFGMVSTPGGSFVNIMIFAGIVIGVGAVSIVVVMRRR